MRKIKSISSDQLDIVNKCLKQLEEKRKDRPKPHLDTKIVCSWNALAIQGFCDAYLAFNDASILKEAEDCAKFVLSSLVCGTSGQLFHTFLDGPSGIYGFAEDYVMTISGKRKIIYSFLISLSM